MSLIRRFFTKSNKEKKTQLNELKAKLSETKVVTIEEIDEEEEKAISSSDSSISSYISTPRLDEVEKPLDEEDDEGEKSKSSFYSNSSSFDTLSPFDRVNHPDFRPKTIGELLKIRKKAHSAAVVEGTSQSSSRSSLTLTPHDLTPRTPTPRGMMHYTEVERLHDDRHGGSVFRAQYYDRTIHQTRRVVIKKQNFEFKRPKHESFIQKFFADDMFRGEPGYPYIVQFIDHFAEKGHLFIVMEDCTKHTLLEVLDDRDDPYPIPVVRRWLIDILLGLQLMHKNGFAHRDLKCENIMLTYSGVQNRVICKLGDFGFSMMTSCVDPIDYERLGSPHYVAPEVLRGNGHDPFATDIWSVGCILYIMVERRMPFDFDDEKIDAMDPSPFKEMLENQKLAEVILKNEIRPRTKSLDDSGLNVTLEGMMNVDPDKRFSVNTCLGLIWLQSGKKQHVNARMEPIPLPTHSQTKVQK
jgi:hypothetical protein